MVSRQNAGLEPGSKAAAVVKGCQSCILCLIWSVRARMAAVGTGWILDLDLTSDVWRN
jgi:hypothetical protein